MNTSVKAILFTSKMFKNGEHPVMLRIIKNRKPKYLSVGFSCTKDMWNEVEGLPIKKHPLYKEAKILIGRKKLEADKLILDLENENQHLSAYEIKKQLKRAKVNNPIVGSYFDQVIERFKNSGQLKNGDIYKDCKRNLGHFCKIDEIHFSDVDVAFLNKFVEFLRNRGKGDNTIYLYLRTFRALLNKAIKEDVCSEKYYPFKQFSLAKYAKIKTEKRAISKEDILKVAKVNLKKSPHLIDARNIFMFSYYCRGMNFIDISFLKWKNIKADRLNYTRKKTKELFNILILDPALEILQFYRKHSSGLPDEYVFPIFDESHSTPQKLHNRQIKMLRQVNKDLKEIGALAKLDTELTTYVARHSYATILKKSGISTSVISQAMGHDSEKTTQIYLESFEDDIIDQASRSIL
ncbi:site-specific integrase [Pollutibacter soli]|uniref:site-specific integrase n=1 Tax=Pollutibacter soli TaxID=3034157 RepID=UPI003013B127